jgi:hypothetical protein
VDKKPKEQQQQGTEQQTPVVTSPFHAWEDEFAKRIAGHTNKKDKTALEVGRIVDEWRERRGNRPEWGEQFMKHVASHPAIDVTRQYLYRCWNAHRMLVQYGEELKKFRLRPSALMQLARVVRADLAPDDQKRLLLECAEAAVTHKHSAEVVRESVTAALRANGESRPRKQRAPDQGSANVRDDLGHAATTVEEVQRRLESHPPKPRELQQMSEGLDGLLTALLKVAKPFSERAVADPVLAAKWSDAFRNFAEELSSVAAALREVEPQEQAA